MANILIIAALCLSTIAPNEAEVKADGVTLRVKIESGLYTYSIFNSNSNPIKEIRIHQHAGYNFLVPDGWNFKETGDELLLWAVAPEAAITAAKPGKFSFRISSQGAVLGQRQAVVKLDSGRQITLPNIWTAKAEPRSHMAMVWVVILGIFLVQTMIVVKKRSKGKATANSC
jgi:hypothetical protein